MKTRHVSVDCPKCGFVLAVEFVRWITHAGMRWVFTCPRCEKKFADYATQGGDMELYKIAIEWLKNNGFDGLCDPSIECGCHIDDFMPCGEPGIHCEAGHQVEAPHDSGVDYFIWPGKAQPEDSPGTCSGGIIRR